MRKFIPTSRDIEHFSPKNASKIKRGFIYRFLRDNWIEIICIIIIIVSIVGGMVLWAESLPDPVMP